MDHEPIPNHEGISEPSKMFQPADLDPRYRRLLVFRNDFENALVKAGQIAGDRPMNSAIIQQSLLLLGYDALVDIEGKFEQIREEFRQLSGYKSEEIDYLVSHARDQEEFRAITGFKRLNDIGIKRNLDVLSVESIAFLQRNFTVAEITRLCSHGSFLKSLSKIGPGKLIQDNADAFHLLFTPPEQEMLLTTFPDIILKLNMGGYYGKISPDLRNRLISDFTRSRDLLTVPGLENNREISPINLAAFFSLEEEERMALLKNPVIDVIFDDFNSDTPSLLSVLKQYAGNDYGYVLGNCNEIALFGVPSQLLENELSAVSAMFPDGIPWRSIYPPQTSDKPQHILSKIAWLSPEAMGEVIDTYGKEVARSLFLSQRNVFDLVDDNQMPLMTRLKAVESVVGPDTFRDLVHTETFASMIDDYYRLDKDFRIRYGRTFSDQMQRAKILFGEKRFVYLCGILYGDYFIRHCDRIVSGLSPDTLDIVFGEKENVHPFYEFGYDLDKNPDDTERLRCFADFPLEKQRILIRQGGVSAAIDLEPFRMWIGVATDELLEAVLRSGILPPDHFGPEAVGRILHRIDRLAGLFGEQTAIDLLGKRTTVRIITDLPEKTIRGWDVLENMPAEDRQFYPDNGLILEVLKNPEGAAALKADYGAWLAVFLQHDPLLKNQLGGLVDRLNRLHDEGRDVEPVIRKLIRQLTDPRTSDPEKAWYLYMNVFGEDWLLKGTDPRLVHLTLGERFRAVRRRLEDIIELSGDPNMIAEADRRNREYAAAYLASPVLREQLLQHGKGDIYPEDALYGYRAAEFLGSSQYQWEEITANALNFMLLEPGQPLIEAYYGQKDRIAVDFGASPDKTQGITHLFRPSDVETAQRRYAALLYDGRHHGQAHKLISCGVPATTELCAIVNTRNADFLEKTKRDFAKRPYPVLLIDAENGRPVFTPEEYDRLRKQMLADGSIVDPGLGYSVDAIVTKIIRYYSDRDKVHGLLHIEHTLQHLPGVCRELFENSRPWMDEHGLTYQKFESLVKITVVSHDLARGISEDDDHAITGAKKLAEIADYGIPNTILNLIQTAIKQHNLPKEKRWSDDPVTRALYDIDKADTTYERGADFEYIRMVLPTIHSAYARKKLEDLLNV